MAKCHQIGVFITAPFDVSSNISAFSGRRRMGIPPFKPAHRDESNGSIPIFLRSLDAELIGKMSSNRRFSTFDTTPFDFLSNISTSSGCRRMKIPPFEPAYRGESNGGIPILLQPLDAELIGEMSLNWSFYYCAVEYLGVQWS